MGLLLVFVVSLLVLESVAVGIGLVVERHTTPYTGLVSFVVCYFAMIWVAWRFAVRITEPRSLLKNAQDKRAPERGKPSAVLLGAYMAADEFYGQSALLCLGV